MIDYINCTILLAYVNLKKLRSAVRFQGTFDCDTNEVHNSVFGELYKLGFVISNGILSIKGSLHIFYNCGEQNYSDFKYEELCFVLDYLEEELGIDISQATLHSVEAGVNFRHSLDKTRLIDRLGFHYPPKGKLNLFYLKQPDVDLHCLKDTKRAIQLKIYIKSKQYKFNFGLLRIEIHVKKARTLNAIGVYKLACLKHKNKLDALGKVLIGQWDSVVLLHLQEEHDHNSLAIKQSTPNYWKKLKGEIHVNTFRNRVKNYKNGFGNKAENIKREISESISAKLKDLLA